MSVLINPSKVNEYFSKITFFFCFSPTPLFICPGEASLCYSVVAGVGSWTVCKHYHMSRAEGMGVSIYYHQSRENIILLLRLYLDAIICPGGINSLLLSEFNIIRLICGSRGRDHRLYLNTQVDWCYQDHPGNLTVLGSMTVLIHSNRI